MCRLSMPVFLRWIERCFAMNGLRVAIQEGSCFHIRSLPLGPFQLLLFLSVEAHSSPWLSAVWLLQRRIADCMAPSTATIILAHYDRQAPSCNQRRLAKKPPMERQHDPLPLSGAHTTKKSKFRTPIINSSNGSSDQEHIQDKFGVYMHVRRYLLVRARCRYRRIAASRDTCGACRVLYTIFGLHFGVV